MSFRVAVMYEIEGELNLRVNVVVSSLQRISDGNVDFIGLRLPCPKTDLWDLCSSVELVALPVDLLLELLP